MPRRPSLLLQFSPRWLTVVLPLALVIASAAILRASPVEAQTLTPGSTAVVSADGDCLRLRAGATLSAALITCLPDGSIVTIRDGSTTADGLQWQFVEASGSFGWVAAIYLAPLGGTTPTATPTESPTSTPAATPTATATPEPTPTPSTPSAGTSAGSISGTLPPAGKVGLVVWSGGSVDSLVATAASDGCTLRSVFVTRGGKFVGYTVGAPAFVNAAWTAQVGADLPPTSAIIVICSGVAQVNAPSPSTDGTGSAPPTTGGQPPGPGGNE